MGEIVGYNKNTQCTFNVRLRRVRVTVVAVGTQERILHVVELHNAVNCKKYWVLHNNDFMENLDPKQQWNARRPSSKVPEAAVK